MTATNSPAVKPPVYTSPTFWITQLGALGSVLVVLAGIFQVTGSFSGVVAAVTVPAAILAAVIFEIVWVVHHDGFTRKALDAVIAWGEQNVGALKPLYALVEHVGVLANLAKLLKQFKIDDPQALTLVTKTLSSFVDNAPAGTVASVVSEAPESPVVASVSPSTVEPGPDVPVTAEKAPEAAEVPAGVFHEAYPEHPLDPRDSRIGQPGPFPPDRSRGETEANPAYVAPVPAVAPEVPAPVAAPAAETVAQLVAEQAPQVAEPVIVAPPAPAPYDQGPAV